MKILLINYRYFVSGGPERYMFSVKTLLEGAGDAVIPFSVRYAQSEPSEWAEFFVDPIARNDEVTFKQHSWFPSTIKRGLERAFYSNEVYRNLSKLIEKTKPDVAFVLHYLRKLSPAVLKALSDQNVPIVVRLSDYAMVCPQAHLLRGGNICEKCVSGRRWPSVFYRCVQGSLAASFIDYAATAYHRRQGYFDLIDAFVAPSAIMREKMTSGGWPREKLHHIPTFVSEHDFNGLTKENSIIYAGRIEAIKGVGVLIDAFGLLQAQNPDLKAKLYIAGEDKTDEALKLKDRIKALKVNDIVFKGALDLPELLKLLARSKLSVVPSLWYENMPNALLESWSAGTPVIATDIGSLSEMIKDTNAGVLFAPGDAHELAQKMVALLRDPQLLERMSLAAKMLVKSQYAPEHHLKRLTELFETTMVRRQATL